MRALAFLLDVDNTLLDNDRVKADLDRKLVDAFGGDTAHEFWNVYEIVRTGEEYVDFPTTVKRFLELRPDLPSDRVASIVEGIDFRPYVYPGAFEAIAHLNTLGTAIVVSDGDPIFQKHKIEQSGIASAVRGRVVLTVHKQRELPSVFTAFPADHYALVDDKATIIADVGREYPERITTVLVCQGKYARLAASPGPDLVVPHIRDLVEVPREEYFRELEIAG